MKKIAIIGSGFGGLMAGNLLAKKGHRVTIFESHSAPGGYIAGFRRKGYYFESGTLSFENSASIFKAMKDLGIYDKIEFVRNNFRLLSPDFDEIVKSYADFKKMLYSAFGSEKKKLDEYFPEVDRMYEAFNDYDHPMPFLYDGVRMVLSSVLFMFRGMNALNIIKKYGNTTVSEFTDRFFDKSSGIYQVLKSFAYPDMSAWMIGASIGFFLEDYWTVRGGMQSWSDLLAENFRSLGGELKLSSRVDRINTSHGKAVGVSCNGTNFEADYVISACDYKKTFLNLLDDASLIPGDLREKISRSAVSEGIFTVYLGLDKPGNEMLECMKAPHVSCNFEQPGCDVYDSADESYFEKTAFLLYSPSLMNPAHAPDERSSLMIQTVVPFRWMDNWGGGDREKYRSLKEKAMKTLIRRAAAVVPDIEKRTEFEDAATPLTYERFTHNSDGATSAWSWNPKKKFFDDMFSSNIETPVRNLLIGSAWATQVGGVPGALGAAYLCAKRIS